MIYRRFGISQSNSKHVHAHVGWHCLMYQSIDIHIDYLCYKYQLIWSYNQLFTDLLLLANQIQEHTYARTDGQFWLHRSIKCLDFYLRHKYQANPMKNNEVIVQWNLLKYNTFVRAHVHACAGRKFWPCRSVGDLNIYLPYKFEWSQTKNKKVSFCTFLCANFQTHMHAHACIFRKKWLSILTSTNARLSSWKVLCWSL
jgi:hypothetical protein